jgi:hypothetical protein
MNRAYSILDVRGIDEEQRVISGLATSPRVDRMGDVIEPLGIKAASSIPLLLYHDSRMVVGTVSLGKATAKGVPFTASLPKIMEPGALQDRVNEAWQLVKYRLIAATSIGFRALDGAVERIDTGLRFLETEVLELSLVPIPAQPDAIITSFKSYCAGDAGDEVIDQIRSIDAETLALSGKEQPAEADLTGAKLVPAAPPAKVVHVAKLSAPARDRADPFVIRKIKHAR